MGWGEHHSGTAQSLMAVLSSWATSFFAQRFLLESAAGNQLGPPFGPGMSFVLSSNQRIATHIRAPVGDSLVFPASRSEGRQCTVHRNGLVETVMLQPCRRSPSLAPLLIRPLSLGTYLSLPDCFHAGASKSQHPQALCSHPPRSAARARNQADSAGASHSPFFFPRLPIACSDVNLCAGE